MKSSSLIVGILAFLVGATAVGAGGYFLYTSIKNGDISGPGSNDNSGNSNNGSPNISYDNDFELDVSKAVPNDDPSSYEIIEAKDLRYTYETLSLSSGLEGMCPSHGNPNILLVPVEFRDLKYSCEWNNETLSQLNGAFNGTKEDHTNEYAESVRSFYNKSSLGTLDLNFEIVDPFIPSITSSQFVELEANTSEEALGTYKIIEEFYKNGTSKGRKINFDSDRYDINNDGYVDGVWLIYNSKGKSSSEKQKYWPYCYWYFNDYIYKNKNYISAYANCSFAFLFEGTTTGYDYHTIAHETGHMMGLDDYYSYDLNGRKPAALGGLDMMDLNIGDHNAYSKTSLGWTNPIIPKKSGEFKLRPFSETGDCIILANDFNNSAFSEYIMLEYYTPTNLNKLDSEFSYPDRPKYFSESGLRAYHVDARLMQIDVNLKTGESEISGYYPSSRTSIPNLSDKSPYYCIVGQNNTLSRNFYAPGERRIDKHLIAAIDADKRQIYGNRLTDNRTLFKSGDKFSPLFYSKYFNGLYFNEGSKNDFTFEVKSFNPDELTVQITL